MKKGIILDTEDVKKIIAKEFNVDVSQVLKSQYTYTVITEGEKDAN